MLSAVGLGSRFRAQLGKAAALAEALDYQGRRNLLGSLGLQVFVYRTDHTPNVVITAKIDLGKRAWLDLLPPIDDKRTEPIDLSYVDRLPGPKDGEMWQASGSVLARLLLT